MRIMAIDYGDAHTGIAISDPTGLLAGFTTVINAYRPDRVTGQIALLAKEHRVERLVLGHPINMDGTRGPRSEKAQAMRQLLEETTGLTVVLWDERRTTIDAHQILMSSGKNAKKRKKVVDAVAASLILEGYLTYLKRTRRDNVARSRTYSVRDRTCPSFRRLFRTGGYKRRGGHQQLEQPPHQRTAEKDLPEKRHGKIADHRLEPGGHQLDPRLLEDHRSP